MKKFIAVISFLDALIYLSAQIGIFVAAAKSSLIWVCVCGFIVVDEAITIAARWIVEAQHVQNRN